MIKPFKRLIAKKDPITAKEWNRLTRLVSDLYKSSGHDFIIDSLGIHIRKRLTPTTTGMTQLAITKEAGQADGLLSCMLLDSAGVETGSAFDVFMLLSKAAVTLATTYPQVANAEFVLIVRAVDSNWYLVRPSLNSVSSITVQTDTSVNGGSKLLQKKTRANVKVRAHRARKKLRRLLEEEL